MPSIPYSDEEFKCLRNVSDVTRNNSMLRRLLSTVDQARGEVLEARGLVGRDGSVLRSSRMITRT